MSSGNYIDRMSEYCGNCRYSGREKVGESACPFNLLYWHFRTCHLARFAANPRMAQMYRTWDRMDPDRREAVLEGADNFLQRLEAGEPV